ncbi:carbohydrate kinase [Marinilabilia sp.]|uniref:carbohydrate kinase family protein n=1 Tax=Marinilabilia sp. TaxID=2021252 RepID=UPI0025BCE352|nr:carbohydrate kinase [Marinilabilia sp.]
MKKPIVIGLGEILWDLLPEGKMLGGAPANFVWHARQLGAAGVVVSAVGKDDAGREILDLVDKKGLGNAISVNGYPTGTVKVELIDGIPSYQIVENVAWDFIQVSSETKQIISQASAICFGSLAQRSKVSADSISDILSLAPQSCLKIFDINLRQDFYSQAIIDRSLNIANVLKINDEELTVLQDLLGIAGNDETACRTLLNDYNLQLVTLTKGEGGSMLLSRKEQSFQPTPNVRVKDTIGAGDSFTAAIVMGLLNGDSLKATHQKAVGISAFVCTQAGAMPVLPEDLLY